MRWNTPGVRLDIIKELVHILDALKVEMSNGRVVSKKPGLASRWQTAAVDKDMSHRTTQVRFFLFFNRLNASACEY